MPTPARSAHMAQLVGRGGPEGVPGGQEDGTAGGGLLAGQLADGGGLAHAVDPDDQPDVGRARRAVEAQRPRVGARRAASRIPSPRAVRRSSPPAISLASTRPRSSASRALVVSTPTSARMSASSSESQVAASILPERRAATAPLNRPRTLAQAAAVGGGLAGSAAGSAAARAAGRSGFAARVPAGCGAQARRSGPRKGCGRRLPRRGAGGVVGEVDPNARRDRPTQRPGRGATRRHNARRAQPRSAAGGHAGFGLGSRARPSGSPPGTSRPGAMVTP